MSARPIPSREEAVSFSAAPSSAPNARLLSLVQTQRILPQDIETLFLILAKMGFITNTALTAVGDRAIRHCKRCHQVYMEKNNGIQACIVQHDKPRLFKLTKATGANGDDPPYKTYYACCNALVDVASSTPKPHFVGRHTTIADNVEFNGINVLPCDDRKCAMDRNKRVTPDPSVGGSRPSTATSSRAISEAPLKVPEDNQMSTT